jgi:hypothetical protein
MILNSLKRILAVVLTAFHCYSFAQGNLDGSPIPSQEYGTDKTIGVPNSKIRCYTMEMDSFRRAQNPGLPSLLEEELLFQQKISEYKLQQSKKAKGSQAKALLLTIPIVFHIITDGSGITNVAQSIVQDQVDQLNLDFRNLSGSPFSVAADVEVEFCLAKVDTNNDELAEPGINRVTIFGAGPFSSGTFDNTIKPMTIWDPEDYYNVWVGDLLGGILGYAQFPSSSGLPGIADTTGLANTDGCVVLYTALGSIANPNGSPSAAYNKGRTLTHETGHWLGLKHVWGDGGCAFDDYCDDTPLSDSYNLDCPVVTKCGSVDMVENYMDYTDDICMNTFTEDQKTRVRDMFLVALRRATLPTSNTCELPVFVPQEINDSPSVVSVFPNPTNGIFSVQVMSNIGKRYFVSVTDLEGKIVYARSINGDAAFEVNLFDKENGMYIINIELDGTVFTRRIVITK